MARNYIRPEFEANDLAEFQAASCIMINPIKSDVATALKGVQKRCRNNKLTLKDAENAWTDVVEGDALVAEIGDWECPNRFRYGMQGTVFQVVRITSDLVGLLCERQEILPGERSRFLIEIKDSLCKIEHIAEWTNEILKVFWTHLTDDDIEALHKEMVRTVLENKTGLRHRVLDLLFRGVTPEFMTEFFAGCRQLTKNLREKNREGITWAKLKKEYPSLTSRFKSEFLSMLDGNSISVEMLQAVENNSTYNIYFSVWRGSQRIFDEPQLVFSVRNFEIHRQFKARGGEYLKLSRNLKKIAGVSCHPGTENTVGWIRVHIDDKNKLCFIDEVQSDTLEVIRQSKSEPEKEFFKGCADWHIHGFTTIAQWAREIGYRVAMHSKESARLKLGMTQSPRKWNTYYGTLIKRFKLKEESISGYPSNIYIQN